MLRHKPSQSWLLDTGYNFRSMHSGDVAHAHVRRYPKQGTATGALKSVARHNSLILLEEYEVVKFSLQEVATFEVAHE